MISRADYNILKNFDPQHKLPGIIDAITGAQILFQNDFTLPVPTKFNLVVVQWFENPTTWNFTVTASVVPGEPQMRMITKISWT